MDKDISKKSASDKGSERANGRSPGGEYQPLPFGPETEMLALHSAIGNLGVGRLLQPDGGKPGMIQAKLTVSQTGDKHEQEADRIANQVMRIPDRAVADEAQSATTVQTQFVQSKGSTEQAAPLAHGDYAPKRDLSRNGGEPLPEEARAFMEPRFKQDFSQVRIHSGPRANTFARMLGARAFTQGSDIVFGAGEFQPTSTTGQRLLAHELAHVGQQAHGQAMPIIQRMPLDEALPKGQPSRVTQIIVLVQHGEGSRVTVDELLQLDLEELETLHKNMKDAFRSAQTEKDKDNVRTFFSERFTPALKRKLRLEERKQRRLEERKLRREEKKRRLTGEDPPKSVDEFLTQLSVAMEHATAEPPNFSAAIRILTQCDKWLRQIVSSDNYYKHWQQLEGNRTEAEALIYRASSEVTFLLSQAHSHAKDEKPVSIENWKLSISIVGKARHYLQILSDQPTIESAQLASSVKRANEIKGGVLLTAASLPFVAMFSAEVLAVAGAEISFLARLVPVFLRSPSAARGLLSARIIDNPQAWYAVFEALLSSGAAVIAIGPEEFAKLATTSSGALELAFQILQMYLLKGAGPGKQAPRRSPVSVGEQPETSPASPSANATSASTAPKAPPSHQSAPGPPQAGEGSPASRQPRKPPHSIPQKKPRPVFGKARGPRSEAPSAGTESGSTGKSTKQQEIASRKAAEEKAARAITKKKMINRTFGVVDKELKPGVIRRRTIVTPKKDLLMPRKPKLVTKKSIEAVRKRVEAMKAKGIESDSFDKMKNSQLASHSEVQQIVSDPKLERIGVSNPMCGNCIEYFRAEARFQSRTLEISDPFTRREFHPDGSYTEFWNDGSIVRVEGFGSKKSVRIEPGQN